MWNITNNYTKKIKQFPYFNWTIGIETLIFHEQQIFWRIPLNEFIQQLKRKKNSSNTQSFAK